MFKKLFDVKKTVVPVAVYEDRFVNTTEAEINKTQTPAAWGVQTDYLILGKVRQIPSTRLVKKLTSTMTIYGEEGDK